jgi:hypothetical protein
MYRMPSRRRSFLILACLFSAATPTSLHAGALSADQRDALISRLVARQKLLGSSTIDYTASQNYTPPDDAAASLSERHVLRKGLRTRTCSLTISNGNIRFESKASPEEAAREGDALSELTLCSAHRTELLRTHLDGARIGNISADPRTPAGEILDIALGLRPMTNRLIWLDAAQMKAWKWSTRDDGQIEATWIDTDGSNLYRFDPHEEDALIFYEGGDSLHHPTCEIRMTEFEQAGTLKVPAKVEMLAHYYLADGVQHTSCATTLRVATYVFHDPTTAPVNPLTVWPKGSAVYDERTKRSYRIGSGDRTLPDELLLPASTTPPVDTHRAPALAGIDRSTRPHDSG